MDPTLLLLILLIVLSMSVLGNITGIGGGIPVVLFFVYYVHLSPVLSTGLSLFMIILSTVVGSSSNLRSGVVDTKLFILIAIPGVVGSVLGSLLADYIPLTTYEGLFSVVTISLGLFSLGATVRHARLMKAGGATELEFLKGGNVTRVLSLIAGAVSGLIGIGIGGIMGTFLTAVANLRPRVAFSTVLLATIPITLVGTAVHLSGFGFDENTILYLIPMIVGTIVGGAMGSYILRRSSSVRSRFMQGSLILSFGLTSGLLFLYTTGAI